MAKKDDEYIDGIADDIEKDEQQNCKNDGQQVQQGQDDEEIIIDS